jgi:hypothetical protein
MSIKIEQAHPFYRPVWRRWLIVGSTVVWTLFEWFVARDPFWGMIATALAGYAGWVLLYTFPAETAAPSGAEKRDES